MASCLLQLCCFEFSTLVFNLDLLQKPRAANGVISVLALLGAGGWTPLNDNDLISLAKVTVKWLLHNRVTLSHWF